LTDYADFFRTATGFGPFEFQVRYANEAEPPVLVEIPTGLGKTETTLLPFIYKVAKGTNLTRRLVYVLPMRSLVEQTRARVASWLEALDATGETRLPKVSTLLGGDVDDIWFREPETPWILIGTQDMLLSRALNRGYSMNPFAWPIPFGLLNNDAHWILDEVQLQGVGTRTAAQLQGLRDRLGTFGTTRTTFVSATIERDWVDTVDHALGSKPTFTLTDADRANPEIHKRLSARKMVARLGVAPDDTKALAAEIQSLHTPGTLTLVVLNRVERAREVANALRKAASGVEIDLLHGQFRLADRLEIADRALGKPDPAGPGRILVSTQVVEAGVDLDAKTLISDLAPWASIVQRLGRCNRRGDRSDGAFYWIDLDVAKSAAPYATADLVRARELLAQLDGGSAAPNALPREKYALDAAATLRRVDLLDLFDTAPDIAGNDVDVSRFIREGDDFNVTVFWRDAVPTGRRDQARRHELCPAPIAGVRKLMERLQKQNVRGQIRMRSNLALGDADVWQPIDVRDLRRGALIWIHASVGGYDPLQGFDPDAKAKVPAARQPAAEISEKPLPGEQCVDDDPNSWQSTSVTLQTHSEDTRLEAQRIVGALSGLLDAHTANLVTVAAAWHDAGKVHEVFQQTMIKSGCPVEGGPWAKSGGHSARHARPHFRHELVSALAWLESHDGGTEDDLVAYLVAAHHGKFRLSAYTYPGDAVLEKRVILGVEQSDKIPGFVLLEGTEVAPFEVDLSLFDIGSESGRPTWADRVLALRDSQDHGPFRLGYLEALVRVSDWLASALRAEGEVGAAA